MVDPAMHDALTADDTVDDTVGDPVALDVADRLVDRLEAATAVRPRDAARVAGALEAVIAACRRDARVATELDLAGLLDELAETYSELGRVDDALQAMHAAIAAGYDSTPDPRCRLAEIALRGGRSEPARELFAQVYADTPDDVWLHNNAGIEYAAVGDYSPALAWLTSGLQIALDSGDPERLVAQLQQCRRDALHALDQPHDELDTQAKAFLAQPRPHQPAWSPATLDLFDTTSSSAPPSTVIPSAPPASTARAAMALAWFPATEFPAALAHWPHLADQAHWATADHTDYNHQLERHLRDLAHQATTTTNQASVSLWIAPIHLEAFHTWCTRHDRDPAADNTRASYAADQARTHPDGLIAWPPERNQPCWCTSGRKYKKCCGHPTATALPT